MTSTLISKNQIHELLAFLKKNKKADLIVAYLHYIEKKFSIRSVLFPKEKIIYESIDYLINALENKGKLWKEAEIKVQFGQQTVNENTKKIYICPNTGKAFGDNTHPNPQDAIYDWVSKCPENNERIDGLKTKRFFISEDPEVIKNYIKKRKASISKVVYTSLVTGKLFNSKNAVIEDFKKNHIKFMTLLEVQNQNRFEIEEHFLSFLQTYLSEDKIAEFVETLSKHEELNPYLNNWLKE